MFDQSVFVCCFFKVTGSLLIIETFDSVERDKTKSFSMVRAEPCGASSDGRVCTVRNN